MRLYTESFYNPFFVDIGDKFHEIEKIHFFDSVGVICSTRCGWFGSNNHFRNGLEIPVDVVSKRKPDFSLSTAFLLSTGEKSWATNKNRYELYIPAAVVGLKEPKAKRSENSRYFLVSWETNIEGVFVDQCEWIDENLKPIEERIKHIGEKMSTLYSDFYMLPEMIKELQTLEKQRQKALFDMTQIQPETILAKFNHKGGKL